MHCALLLAVVMLSLAIMYAMQGAPFLAFVQIIVYTGAVLMLFLFVLMLVGVDSSDSLVETIQGQRLAAVARRPSACSWSWSSSIGHAAIGRGRGRPPRPTATATSPAWPHLIFTRYVFAFEVTGALLITAALGAMVLAHRERTAPKPTPARPRRPAAAPAASSHPTRRPGVYARHNAVDTPGPAAGRQRLGAVGQPDAVAA